MSTLLANNVLKVKKSDIVRVLQCGCVRLRDTLRPLQLRRLFPGRKVFPPASSVVIASAASTAGGGVLTLVERAVQLCRKGTKARERSVMNASESASHTLYSTKQREQTFTGGGYLLRKPNKKF